MEIYFVSMARHVATLQAFLWTCSPCTYSYNILLTVDLQKSFGGCYPWQFFMLPLQRSKGGVPLGAHSIRDLSQTSSWWIWQMFTKNYKNILDFSQMVDQPTPSFGDWVDILVWWFESFLRDWEDNSPPSPPPETSPVWICDKVISTSFNEETIFNPPLKHLTCWH